MIFGTNVPPASAQDELTAQDCSNIVKNVTASEGSTITLNIAGADCSAGGAKLRVTYFWLDDVATGHILSGYLPPTLRRALGRDYPVVRNVVFDEVKALFDRFGQEVDPSVSDSLVVSTCFDTGERDRFGEVRQCTEDEPETYRRERRSIPGPADSVRRLPQSEFFVPLPEAESVLAGTERWPEGFRFHYSWDGDADQIFAAGISGEPIQMPNFQLWRPAEVGDIRGLGRRVQAYARDFVEGKNAGAAIFGFPSGQPPATRAERQSAIGMMLRLSAADLAEARFLEHISRDTDIANLAYVYAAGASCDAAWQFRLVGPVFKLLIAVVENAGDRPVAVDRVNVLSNGRTELRQIATVDTAPDATWREDSIRLPRPMFRPGDGVLIPMRIEFRNDPQGIFTPSDGAAYDAIRGLPPDTPIYFLASDIAKPVSSFGPHSGQPEPAVFAYGPEISLKKAQVQNQEIALRQVDPTAISLYVGFEVGSCPYVYGFDGDSDAWRLQSRAIVGAINRSLAYEDRFRLMHFDGRLKLVEHEPEVSFIDDVVVDVAMADGMIRRLLPDDPRLEYRDGKNFVVAYPGEAEISFPGFADIDESAVESIEIRIFGHYREFGTRVSMASVGARGPVCNVPRRGL